MQASLDTVWTWLGEIPDPEIPVISLADLGIIRDVGYDDDRLVVTVTPTYSGCPATSIIALDIETELLKRGAQKVEIRQQLSPAWTTDWISQEGREKLRAFGIAPPAMAAANCAGMLKAQNVACPHCGSEDTENISPRGSTPCKAQFRCRSCMEPFDYFKAI